MATKKKVSTKTAVEIGAGVLAAAAAAGAGYYFYGDKNAKKHRQAASKWTKGMKNEVVKEAKKLKRIDQKTMAAIVDRAAAAYQDVRSVDAGDLRAAAMELKKNWRKIQGELETATRSLKRQAAGTAKSVKKTAAKGARKAVKKATPKKVAKKTAKRSAKK